MDRETIEKPSDMRRVPRFALVLGLAGVIPFIAATLLAHLTDSSEVRQLAQASLSLYSVTILAFMSGCIWAFAAKAEDVVGYALSTLPALFGCAMPIVPVYFGYTTPQESMFIVGLAFAALLLLDVRAWWRKQTPPWWLHLRLLLTVIVVPTILYGATA